MASISGVKRNCRGDVATSRSMSKSKSRSTSKIAASKSAIVHGMPKRARRNEPESEDDDETDDDEEYRDMVKNVVVTEEDVALAKKHRDEGIHFLNSLKGAVIASILRKRERSAARKIKRIAAASAPAHVAAADPAPVAACPLAETGSELA